MKKLILSLLILISMSGHTQSLQSVSFMELQKVIQETEDSIVVCNFWATWCKPCIEELPYFEKVHEDFSGSKVKVILVNLDFESRLESATLPFIKKNKLNSTLYHLKDSDPNQWIDLVEPTWSGAIPATVIYVRAEKTFFHEGELKESELRLEVEKAIEVLGKSR